MGKTDVLSILGALWYGIDESVSLVNSYRFILTLDVYVYVHMVPRGIGGVTKLSVFDI